MNDLVLIGRLCADPEARATANGTPVTRFRLAVGRRFLEGGERKTDFFSVVCFRQQAEYSAKHLQKGTLIAVHGEIHIDFYKGRDGQSRMNVEVSADDVRKLAVVKQSQAGDETDLTDNLDDGFPF